MKITFTLPFKLSSEVYVLLNPKQILLYYCFIVEIAASGGWSEPCIQEQFIVRVIWYSFKWHMAHKCQQCQSTDFSLKSNIVRNLMSYFIHFIYKVCFPLVEAHVMDKIEN